MRFEFLKGPTVLAVVEIHENDTFETRRIVRICKAHLVIRRQYEKASLHGFSGIAITCVHDYMVTVKVTKIYGKVIFYRWALANTAIPTTLTSRFPTAGYARVL